MSTIKNVLVAMFSFLVFTQVAVAAPWIQLNKEALGTTAINSPATLQLERVSAMEGGNSGVMLFYYPDEPNVICDPKVDTKRDFKLGDSMIKMRKFCIVDSKKSIVAYTPDNDNEAFKLIEQLLVPKPVQLDNETFDTANFADLVGVFLE